MTNNTHEDDIFIASDGKKYKKEVVNFEDLKESDFVLSSSNEPTAISEAYEEHIPETMFELTTDSGETIKASGNHLWYAITNNDRDLYHYRLRLGKKLGKNISQKSIKILEEIAMLDSVEISVREMLDSIDERAFLNNPLSYAILRVAEGVGPIAERNFFIDYLDDESDPLLETTVILYDSKRFAQQLLSFFNVEKYRKKWPLLVGRVMTTEELAEYEPGQVFIPDVEKQ